MTHRRAVSKKFQTRKAGTPYVLRVEPLEARRLLAGIQVSVFVDSDGSRNYDETQDSSAADRLVYLDLDRNGSREVGEPIQVTNAEGFAYFEDLSAGDYSVGLLTNPISQRQTTSIRVAQVGATEQSVDASILISDSSLNDVWAVDFLGGATRLFDDSPTVVDFGGPVVDFVMIDDDRVLLIVDSIQDETQRVVEFNVESGELVSRRVTGLANGTVVSQLAQTTSTTWALVESEQGTAVATLDVSDSGVFLSEQFGLDAVAIAGSPVDSMWASIRVTDRGTSLIGTRGPLASGTPDAEIELEGVAESVVFSADGQLLFVAMKEGGVNAIAVSAGELAHVAILAGARGPISAGASDGRFVTGSTSNDQEIIVWDPESWLPVGSTTFETDEFASDWSIVTDRFGDLALVGDGAGVRSIDMAIADLVRVSVGPGEDVATVQLGVRVVGENSAPDLSGFETRQINEDTIDEVSFNVESGVLDAEGDTLWFSVITPAENGVLEMAADGEWEYLPSENFSGEDSAVVRVYDGLTATDLVVHWQISPVNDPPSEILVQLPDIAENPELGASIGFVSVVDADRDAQYRITTSDPRFAVSNGQVTFVDGELDYDSEQSIAFDILATDVDNPDFFIASNATLTLTNVNEPPTSIELASDSFAENELGANVGPVVVDDPDADSEYTFEVSDNRFEVRDGILRLRDGEAFDFESEETVEFLLTAREVGGGHQIAKTVSLSVVDNNDPPTDVLLSRVTVEGSRDGAIVGEISVVDDDGDAYTYVVSDDRFYVVDGVLRLRDGIVLSDAEGSSIPVSVVATSAGGDQTSRTFPIIVVSPTSPHQNPVNPGDVNGDGIVSPLDALIIINELNENGPSVLPTISEAAGEGSTMPDVNGDGILSPIDVLIIINELNNIRSEAEGEAQQSFSRSQGAPFDDVEKRREQNSLIDAELESLLEELSKHRLS